MTKNDNNDSYDDILNSTWDEFPEEKTLPDGKYILKARNASFQPAKGDSNPKVLYFFTVAEPYEVDDAELAALGEDYDITENEVVYTVWVERKKDWRRVKEMNTLLGVDLSLTVLDQLKAVKGASVIATLSFRSYTNKAGQNVEQNEASSFEPID